MSVMMKPTISSYFNVDDIRKLREYNAIRYENMVPEEIVAEIREGADDILRMLDEQNKKDTILR